ncbi:MAG: type II secretion system F family protein [Vicinamibacterales bacterium]
MLLPAVVFAAVFLVVVAVFWAVVVRPEQQEQRLLRKRLHFKKPKAQVVTVSKETERLSSVDVLDKALSRRRDVVAPIERLIEQADLNLNVGTFLLSSACLGLMGYLVVVFTSRILVAAMIVGLVFAALPYVYVKYKRDRRVRQFEELFPEAIDLITRALRAGHAFTTGLGMVADEMPQPIAGEFKLLYDRQNFGLPLPLALRAFAERIPLLDARFFVTAVLTQREAGGNLSEVLDNLAAVIRDRFKLKREVRAKSAHGRMTGWILAGMPPTLALAFLVVSPGHVRMLIEDPLGVQMIIGALVLQIAGTLVIRKIVNIDY